VKWNGKHLYLLTWVIQFGFSVLFPVCFFLMLGVFLQRRYGWGMWTVILFGILGLMTSFSTARSCVRSLRKAAEEAGSEEKPPLAFNDHD